MYTSFDDLAQHYVIDVYKLDAFRQLTEDTPYLTLPFEFKYSPADPKGDNDEIFALETQVRKLAHEKRPSIDCAGYRVICRDLDGGEHLPFDVMY